MPTNFTRRQFGRALGGAVGAALVAESITPRAANAAAARLLEPTAENPILLNSNENPYGPSQCARDAMTRAQDFAARYPDDVEEKVQRAIAQAHSVGTENILLGCGSGEILRMADLAFLAPGKNVVATEPTFEAVLHYAAVTKAEARKVPQTADYRHDLTAMAAACDANTGLVYVCNPNNPTGTLVSRDELAAFLPRVPRTAVVMVDEAYHHFVEDPAYASAESWLRRMPNLMVVRTFSKVYGMAGMRLGYAIAAPELVRAMRVHRFANNVNYAVAEAVVASLADANHVPHHRKLNNDTRRWLCQELEREGRRHIASHTSFVMIEVGREVAPIIEAFYRRHVHVGRRFPSMPHWLRISIGTRAEMQTFLAGLRDIVPAAVAARAA